MKIKLLILNLIVNIFVIKLQASTSSSAGSGTSASTNTNQVVNTQAATWAYYNSLSSALAQKSPASNATGYVNTDFSSMPVVPVSVLPAGDYTNSCINCTCRNNILDCLCNNQKKSLNYQGLCDPSQTVTFLDNNLTPTSGYWYEFCKLDSFINTNLPTNTNNSPIFANIITANLKSFRNNVLSMTNLYTDNSSTSTSTSTSTNTGTNTSASTSNLNSNIATIANNYNAANLAASLAAKQAGEQLIIQQKQAMQVAQCKLKKLFFNFNTGSCGTAGAISAPCTSTGSKVYNFSTGSCQTAAIAQNIADCRFIHGVYNISTGSCNQTKVETDCQITGGFFDPSTGICDQSGPESACQNKNGVFNTVTGICDQSVATASCTNAKGVFLPTFGSCNQTIAQNTCVNSVEGDFNTATGSCSSQPLGSVCTSAKGVFSYSYNSDNTAITTSCNQSAAISACTTNRGIFGPLWPAALGTCSQAVAKATCVGSPVSGDFNTATGSCSNQPLAATCTNAKGVFSYNYNSDNTAITTNCDQSAAITNCTAANGSFGPLWPAALGTCVSSEAKQAACVNPPISGDFNPATGSCTNTTLSDYCVPTSGTSPALYGNSWNGNTLHETCDQSGPIRTCSAKNGVFGPLWPSPTAGTCNQSVAQKACTNGSGDFNPATGSCTG